MAYKDQTVQEVLLSKLEAQVETLHDEMKEGFARIERNINSGYVRKEEFEPIKRVVYGLVSTILLAFVGAIIALVLK